jgi:tetratricopeptide (TPR) repeat protein
VGVELRFTRDDLDELSDTADEAAEPADVAAKLISIAEGGRLTDPADEAYAYLLAAEVYERADALADALTVAERALGSYQASGGRRPGSARAFRAQLLLRLGREAEAMAELTVLRPLMATDALAASYVPEALAAGGRPDLAESWLAGALAEWAGADSGDPVVAQLIATRDRLAEAPGDGLADRMGPYESEERYASDYAGEVDLALGMAHDEAEAVLLFWPQAEYDQVDEAWPEVLEATGADDWDDYRLRHQAVITAWWQRHRAPLWQVTATAAGFAEFLSEEGVDEASADLVWLARRYGDYLADQVEPQPLPPHHDDQCWCGSGLTYQACCLRSTPR